MLLLKLRVLLRMLCAGARLSWVAPASFTSAATEAKRTTHTRHTLASPCSSNKSEGCGAVVSVLGQYRRAVASSGGRDALRRLPPAQRDAALRAAMAREGSLHPAFVSPEGHYEALRELSDSVLGCVLPRDVACCRLMRPLLRELFAVCVLRSTLLCFTPSSINRVRGHVLTIVFGYGPRS